MTMFAAVERADAGVPAWITFTGLIIFAVVLSYALSCWWLPFANCRVCKGSGKKYGGEKKRNFRPCWWCTGTGRRLRWGRRIYNFVNKQRAAAQGVKK